VPGETASDRILTIPNVISSARLLGVGLFWWTLLALEDHTLAAIVILLTGGTDWIDGRLARRLNQVTRLGKALDPAADRLMIASAVIGGMIASVIPPAIGWLLIVREALMSAVTLTLAVKGRGTLEVRRLGKVSTFVLYAAIPAFYLAEGGVLEGLTAPLAWVAAVIGLALYWVVTLQYLVDARLRLAGLESGPTAKES